MGVVLDASLAGKLKEAFDRNGWTEELIDKLCTGDTLGQFRDVSLGNATIVKNLVDLSATPRIHEGWKIQLHRPGQSFIYSPRKVSFYVPEGRGRISLEQVIKDMGSRPVYNTNLFDYWWAHPYLIPEECKDKFVLFPGTIFEDTGGDSVVQMLFWSGQWCVGALRLYEHLSDRCVIAVPAG